MQTATPSRSSYLRKPFLFNHGVGLVVGGCFPFVAYAMLGDKALTPAFIMACLFAGLVLGAASFWFVTQTLKKQLHEQLIMLHELLGEDVESLSGQTVENLLDTVNSSVSRVRNLLTNLYPNG